MGHLIEASKSMSSTPTPVTGGSQILTAQQEAALRAEVRDKLHAQTTMPPHYVDALDARVVQPFLARIVSKTQDMLSKAFQDSVQAYLHTKKPEQSKENEFHTQMQSEVTQSLNNMNTDMKNMFGDSFRTTIEAEMDKYVTAQIQKHECPGECFQCNFDTGSLVCTINIHIKT